MTHSADEPFAEALLAQATWLRALVRELVEDSTRIDDVCQSTMMRAWQYRPSLDRSLRPWLARVARNLSRQLHWREGQRAARESRAAVPDQTPAAAEVVQRVAWQRTIVDLVMTLDEPYRTTILLRYWEAAPPREIARRMGVPVETVRTRVKRGLATLRTRLDRRWGDRRAWIAALQPLAPFDGSLLSLTAVLIMTNKLTLIAALLLGGLTLGIWGLVPDPDRGPRETQAAAGETGSTGQPNAASPGQPNAASAARSAASTPQPTSPGRRQPVPGVGAGGDRAMVFRGRCVDDAGRPLAGVLATLRAWAPGPGDAGVAAWVAKHGPIDWRNPAPQRTGPDGGFAVRAALPRPYMVNLSLSADGYATVSGHWRQLVPGTVKDFVQVVMPRGCTVRGRVVDDAGQPRAAATVLIQHRPQTRSRASGDTLVPAESDSVTTGPHGTFRWATPIAPGKWTLSVRGEQLIAPRSIAVSAQDTNREVTVTVRSKASIPTIRGTACDDRGRPVGEVRISFLTAERWSRITTAADGSFTIERPADDEGTSAQLTAHKPGFEDATPENPVPWGTDGLKLVLRRGASITIVVTDATTRRPIEDYRVRILRHGTGWPAHDEGLRGRGPHAAGRLLLEGMRRGDYRFRIEPEHPGWVSSRFRIVSVGEGHRPEVRFELTAPVRRSIRVTDGRDRPVVGTRVELLEPLSDRPVDLDTIGTDHVDVELARDSPFARLWCSGATGAQGELALTGPGGRPLAVRILGPGHAPIVVREVELGAGSDPLVVVVRVGAVVFGRITPRRLVTQMLELSRCAALVDGRPPVLAIGSTIAPINVDGTFELAGIAAGSSQLRIRWWQSEMSSISSHSLPIQPVDDLRDGERRKVELDLGHLLFARVRGHVELNGEAYEGVLSFHSVSSIGATRSNAEGDYATALPPGTYRLEIRPPVPGRANPLVAEPALVLAAEQSAVQDFRVRGVELRVRVLGPDGKPRNGLRLRAQRRGASRMFLTLSDDDGLSKTWLSPGSYHLAIWPRALSGLQAVEKFEREHRDDPEAAERALVPVATVVVEAEAGVRVVRLPEAAGY